MFGGFDYRYHWLRVVFGIDFLKTDENITEGTWHLFWSDLEKLQDLVDYSKAEIIEDEKNFLRVRIDGVKYDLKCKDLPGHVLLSSEFIEWFDKEKHDIAKVTEQKE